MASITPPSFQRSVLQWYEAHGRKDLPWQQHITPYRVWVSEIMLQQTQVSTVIPYFERFMQHFPDVNSLARADLDQALHLWSGLGYYARARNLHKTAQIITEQYHSIFPNTVAELVELPGIGLSTAGAILSLSMQIPAAILDGNVKRVLARMLALNEWPGKPQVQQQLWQIAQQLTPERRVHHYNQAMMDLGATLCTRSKPRCNSCPLTSYCLAYQQQNVSAYPAPKPKKALPKKQVFVIALQNAQQEILLIKRPPTGIWGSLWSLPECPEPAKLENWCQQQLALTIKNVELLPAITHTFSHFHLTMTPVHAQIKKLTSRTMEDSNQIWYNNKRTAMIGLPAPIQKFLENFYDS